MRGTQLQIETILIVECCCNCGMLFAMPEDVRARRINDHALFYCPAGHSQSYSSKSEAEKLRDELKRAEKRAKDAKADYEDEYNLRRSTERSLIATKGQLTRTKNRVANGVCPCCNRSFSNLGEHMHMEHPDYTQGAADAKS